MKVKEWFTLYFAIIGVAGLAIAVIIIGSAFFGIRQETSDKREIIAQVKDKYIKNKSDGDGGTVSIYMVDVQRPGEVSVETLENRDSIFNNKHNSATVYANLFIGEWYKFEIVGYRNENFSLFPNILKAEKAASPYAEKQ